MQSTEVIEVIEELLLFLSHKILNKLFRKVFEQGHKALAHMLHPRLLLQPHFLELTKCNILLVFISELLLNNALDAI